MVMARRNRYRITVETPTRTANAYGEPVETFTTKCTCYAKVENTIGREAFNGFQEVNEYPFVFRIRYDDTTKTITEKMRVNYNSKYYDIEAVVDFNNEHREIYLYTKNRGT